MIQTETPIGGLLGHHHKNTWNCKDSRGLSYSWAGHLENSVHRADQEKK
jgi:hypothetical protein